MPRSSSSGRCTAACPDSRSPSAPTRSASPTANTSLVPGRRGDRHVLRPLRADRQTRCNSDADGPGAVHTKPDGSVVTQTIYGSAPTVDSASTSTAFPASRTRRWRPRLTRSAPVPIVAERAMYWPGGFFDYYEGHRHRRGSTTTALQWLVAGAEERRTRRGRDLCSHREYRDRTGPRRSSGSLPEASRQ